MSDGKLAKGAAGSQGDSRKEVHMSDYRDPNDPMYGSHRHLGMDCRRCGRGDYPGIGLGLGRGTRANPCRVEQRHAPADDSTGDAPYNARLEPAAVTSSQSAVTRSQKLLSGPAAKAGRFLFEREPKTYEH